MWEYQARRFNKEGGPEKATQVGQFALKKRGVGVLGMTT